MICYNCNKEINEKNKQHIYFCDSTSVSKEEKRIKQLKFSNQYLDKKVLEDFYLIQEISIVEISEKTNISYSIIGFLLTYYKIPKRNIKEACSTIKTIKKREDTCNLKFGVSNPSKSIEIKKKKSSTFMKNYGVSNIFKSKDFIESLPEIMNGIYGVGSLPNRNGNMNKWWNSKSEEFKKEHMLPAIEAFKISWASKTEDEKCEILEKRANSGSSIGKGKSKLEDRLSSILALKNVSHVRQKWVKRNSFDFLLEYTNIIIEVNGDYFHANPTIFKETDTINIFGNILTAKDIWKRDQDKRELAKRHGYDVYYIWESEFNKLNDEELYELVKKIIRNHYEDKEY